MAFYDDQADPYGALGQTVSHPRRPAPPPSGAPRPLIAAAPPMATPQAPGQDASSYGSANSSNANADRTRTLTPLDAQGQDLQNRLRQLELERQGRTADQQYTRDQNIADINAMSDQIGRVGQLYNQNFRDSDPMISLGLSENERQFDAAAGQLRQQAQGAFRNVGTGTVSDYDARLLEQAYGLTSQQWDVSNEEILDGMARRLNQRRAAVGLPPIDWRQSQVPQGDPNLVQPGESMGQVGTVPNPAMAADPGQNQLDNAGGMYVTSQDRQQGDIIARTATEIAQRTGNPETVSNFLRRMGRPPLDMNQTRTLNSFRRRGQLQRFPGYSPTYVPTGRSDPNLTTGMANSAPGAAVIAAGDAMSFGLLDNATADPERTRAGMELLRNEHPVASVAGEAMGSLVPGVGIERGVGYGLRALNEARGVGNIARGAGEARTIGEMAQRPAGNFLYGAGYGAGSADQLGDNRLAAALRGGAFSAVGGEVGDRVVGGVGRAFTGSRNAAVRALADRGIPLTIGDIAGQGGAFGRGISRVQNVLESVPALGDAIRGRRADANQAFNRAAFEDALKPIGASTNGVVGSEGVDIARNAVRDAYSSALDNVRVTADRPFVQSMTAVLRGANRLPPDLKAHFDNFVTNRVSQFMANGQLSGRAFQALRQEIRQDINAASGQLGEGAYRTALKRTEAVLSGLVRRHSPETRQALKQADQAFRGSRIVEGGVNRAINNDAPGVFTPAQLGMEARQNANRFGGNAATTQRPFYQLQRDAQSVLPSRLPNSGTADRSWVLQTFPAIAAGTAYQLGFLDPKTAALFAGLGIPYTRTGQRAFQKLLVSRPDRVRQIGEAIIARHGIGANLGAGAINPITDQTPNPSGR